MFCRNCAELMADTDVTCPNCGFAAGTGNNYCGQCGTPTAVGAVVCELCGNPVSGRFGAQQPQYQQPPQPQPQFQDQYGQQAQYAQQPQYQDPYAQQNFSQPNVNLQNSGQAFSTNQFQQPNATQQFRSDPNQGVFGQQQGTFIPPNSFGQQVRGSFDSGMNGYYQNVTYKSRVGAGVLGILFGCLGVHNFYLGYSTKGMVQLLMTLLSCGSLAPITFVWGLVEGILILTGHTNQDGKGLPLKD